MAVTTEEPTSKKEESKAPTLADADKLWLHTRGYGPNAYAELSGDVIPVISFTRESFFVPDRFQPK